MNEKMAMGIGILSITVLILGIYFFSEPLEFRTLKEVINAPIYVIDNLWQGYFSDNTYYNNDGLEFTPSEDGYVEISEGGITQRYFGFGITSHQKNLTVEDYTWDWKYNETTQILGGVNITKKFRWNIQLDFQDSERPKITHNITNNWKNLTNVKMWYIFTVNEGEVAIYDDTVYNLSEDYHKSGNLNGIAQKIIFPIEIFNFTDVVLDGFDIKDFYVGNASRFSRPEKRVLAVGISKGTMNLKKGKNMTIDPTIYKEISDSEDCVFCNRTEFVDLGARLVYNGTAQTGYNSTVGDFRSLVFFNSTATNWNITMSIANSSGQSANYDFCDSDISCVAYWDLGFENSETDPYKDEKNSHDGTKSGTVPNKTGISSKAIEFDGVNDIIQISDDDNLSFGNGTADQPFTISAWVYADAWATESAKNNVILMKRFSGATDNEEYQFTTKEGDLRLTIFDKSASAYRGRSYSVALDTSTWYHVVGTYDGRGGSSAEDGIDLYVNGKVVDDGTSTSGTYVAMENLGSNVFIGDWRSDTSNIYEWDGVLDEIILFNDTLTRAEVEELYKVGLSQHANTNITLEVRTSISYNLSDSDLMGIYGFNNDTTIGENHTLFVSANGKYNGTCSDCPTYSEMNGTVGGGLTFSGASDDLNIVDLGVTGNNDRTIAFWMKPDTSAGNIEAIYSNGGGGSNGNDFIIGVEDEAIAIAFQGHRTITPKGGITDGEWYHIAVRSNGAKGTSDVEIFIDGVKQTLSDESGSNQTMDTEGDNIQIGDYSAIDDYDGALDELITYNRSLSEIEIISLYNLGLSHIDWTDWQTESIMHDGVANHTSNASFLQFRANFNTNDTFVSPYILNYSVERVPQGTVIPASDDEYPIFSDYWDNNATQNSGEDAFFNVSVSSTNGTVFLEFNEEVYQASNTSTIFNVTMSMPEAAGVYSYYWGSWGNGTAENYNTSGTRFYTVLNVDAVNPNLTYYTPENITYPSTLISLNASCTDNVDIQTYYYSLDSGTNTTFTPNITISTTGYEIWHTLQVWCNDSWGNEATEIRRFYIGSTGAGDTNATTECGDGELLLGNGTCINEDVYLSTFNQTYHDYGYNQTTEANKTVAETYSDLWQNYSDIISVPTLRKTCRYKKFGYYNENLPFMVEANCI